MSSTEPPSRIPPKEQSQDSKIARDQLSSRERVEKVREVDPDEEARKKKFLKYYQDDGTEEAETSSRLSPFDLCSSQNGPKSSQDKTEEAKTTKTLGESSSQNTLPSSQDGKLKKGANPISSEDFDDVEEAIIPSPTYTSPPNAIDQSNQEEELTSSQDLPQSDDFWKDVDLPNQPPSDKSFQETEDPQKNKSSDQNQKKEESTPAKATEGDSDFSSTPTSKKQKKGIQKEEDFLANAVTHDEKRKEDLRISRTKTKKRMDENKSRFLETESIAVTHSEKRKQDLRISRAKTKKRMDENRGQFLETESIAKDKEGIEKQATRKKSDPKGEKKKEQTISDQKRESEKTPLSQERGSELKEFSDTKNHEDNANTIDIQSPISTIPAQIAPLAQAATAQATPYLDPTTASLFYQMVGTVYVMQDSGVSRTEIILNNPSLSESKFYGSKITIEKYQTAPDSFNISLTGSNEAVVSFKENIPSLMSAFENSNLPFRVNRLDAEYTLEKPIFRRKEKGTGSGDTGSGDSGDRRNS